MSLLFLDGFDHSTGSPTTHLTKYNTLAFAGTITVVSTPVRTGSGAIQSTGTFNYERNVPPIAMGTAFIVGFAHRKAANPPTAPIPLSQAAQTGVVVHLGVGLNQAGQLFVYRGTTATVLATGTTFVPNNSWFYVELKGVIHDTLGSYELRIDETLELSATNVDTRNGGTGVVDSVAISCGSTGGGHWWDDFYICDGNGPAPQNDFLGAIKVDTLLPQTDAIAVGSNAGLTPSTGTDHGALVDENPPNTTDYNSSVTVGAKDTYNYPPMTLAGTIIGIQTCLYAQKSDIAPRSVCAVVRTNSLDFDGANVSPLSSFGYLTECRALNPNTGLAWTIAEIALIQAGMKVTV